MAKCFSLNNPGRNHFIKGILLIVSPSGQVCESFTLIIMSIMFGMKRSDGGQSWVNESKPRASVLGLSEHCSLSGHWIGTSLGKA